jgi:hypothetical protein
MTEYKLINPHIEGTIPKLYSGETSLDAADSAWSNLSSYFTNCVPRFGFTMERVKDGKLCNFVAKESVKDGNVSYTITESNTKVSAAQKKKFNKKLSEFQGKVQSAQNGGVKNWLDDDEELVELFLFTDHMLVNAPITHYWYYPHFYQFEYDYYFVPTWTPHVTPYMFLAY